MPWQLERKRRLSRRLVLGLVAAIVVVACFLLAR